MDTIRIEVSIDRGDGARGMGETLQAMREWFDRHRINPSHFTYVATGRTAVFEMRFDSRADAEAFQREFARRTPLGRATPAGRSA